MCSFVFSLGDRLTWLKQEAATASAAVLTGSVEFKGPGGSLEKQTRKVAEPGSSQGRCFRNFGFIIV